ncbi:MAG: N-acetylmuramoyl-L-alanine amidase [Clostridia bacterium]|nr:N-acetylmuramoyl-L-alanine amidase [Clostridia bacterium]
MAIKIFIDQGHNPSGVNGGAEGNGLVEQDITYIVGKYLYDLLMTNGNFSAKLSRETADQVLGNSNATSLYARTSAANAWGADYFISIHVNSSVSPAANGTEGYVYAEKTESYYLAENMVNAVCERMGTANRGVFTRPSLYVLRRTNMPSVLMELAYISNYDDAEKLRYDPYGFAFGMYMGILRFFGMNA